MDADLVRRRLEDAGDDLGRERAELGAGPDVGRLAVLRDVGNRVHRLHLGVIGVFGPIGRFHLLGRATEAGLGVTDLVFDLGFSVGVLALGGVVRFRLFRVETGGSSAAGVPGHLERLDALARRLDAVAEHRHAERQRDDLDDALDLHDVGNVDPAVLRLGAFHRRLQHRGVDHARHLHVDAELRRAVHLQRHVVAADILAADQLEPRRLLEIGFGDLRRLGRHGRELHDLAIADTPRLIVDDRAVGGGELAHRHFPFLRHRIDQHLARLRAGHAQRHEIAGDRRRLPR